jgi:asparagine synthase (glutamine-hydrolysing)
MCGISGIWSLSPIQQSAVEAITGKLAHRGPDAQSVFLNADQSIALGHRRLSVIDLSNTANQPMVSASGRYVIVFNGEIYNYVALRNELSKQGIQFKTASDTEVLLAGFEKWGTHVLNRLEGMFAFAILDQAENKIFLVRDRLGKKPLYYYSSNQVFVFASEPKAILAYPGISMQPNQNALTEFLHVGYIPEPLTAWQNMFKLPSGTWAEVSAPDKIDVHRYWSLKENANIESQQTEQGLVNQFYDLLQEAVSKRLQSDVPLGALLSGGTDSSLICAVANQLLDGKLKTFNIGFDDQKFDERRYAQQVANKLGTEHHSFTLSSKDALTYMEEYLIHFDEPFADTSAIPTLMVSEKTRAQVTVALTGDGGDELFLGYGSYQWAERLNTWDTIGNLLSPVLQIMPAPFSKAGAMFSNSTTNRQHLFSVEQGFFSQVELKKMIKPDFIPFTYAEVNYPHKTPAEQQALFDLNYYLKDDLLVKVDRASMRYGLECRCPLLDHKLVEFAIALPAHFKLRAGVRKYLPKRLLERYLPNDLIHRPKWGFSIPLEKWLRTDLSYMIDTHLNEAIVNRYGLLKAHEVSLLVNRFRKGEGKLYHRIWALIVLHHWLQVHAK